MSLYRRASCLLVVSTFFYFFSLARTGISLPQLLRDIGNHSPSLIADSAGLRIRQLQADQIRFNWLPSFRLNYQADIGTNNNLPGGYFSYGIVPGNSRVQTNGNASAILTDLGIAAFDWEIYNFGAYKAQNQVATSDVRLAKAGYDQASFQLTVFAIEAYFQLDRLQELELVQARTITRNEEIRQSINALAKNGIRAGVDTSIAEAALSKARLNYIEIAYQLQKLRLQLGSISGLDTNSLDADTTYPTRIQDLLQQISLGIPDSQEHPMIQPYLRAIENSLDREQLVRKTYNPKISLDAAAWSRGSSLTTSNEYNPLRTGFGFERSNYLFGLGISYNVFDLKRKQLQLRIQRATTQYDRKRLDEAREELKYENGSAAAELRIARQRLDEIPRQLAAASAAYRQKLSLYKNGLTDIMELDEALNVLYRAETDAITARYLYCISLFHRAAASNQLNELLSRL